MLFEGLDNVIRNVRICKRSDVISNSNEVVWTR